MVKTVKFINLILMKNVIFVAHGETGFNIIMLKCLQKYLQNTTNVCYNAFN